LASSGVYVRLSLAESCRTNIKLMVVPHSIVCAVLVFIVELQSNILTNTCKDRSLHFTDVDIMLQIANKIKQNFLP